jgi:uncharacterized membrane protein YqjE
MPDPEGSGSGASPGLFASLRSFWSVLLAILYTRLDLVTAELQEQATHGIKLVVTGVVALLAFVTAFFFANFFLIVFFWHTEYRLDAIGAVVSVYVLISLVSLLIARNLVVNRPKFLGHTIAELRKDAEGLSQALSTKKPESKS